MQLNIEISLFKRFNKILCKTTFVGHFRYISCITSSPIGIRTQGGGVRDAASSQFSEKVIKKGPHAFF